MEPIIAPIATELLKSELTAEKLLRKTNKADNEIYVVNYKNAPNVLREIGRLREESFRPLDCGSGKDCDLDYFDLEDDACQQLIVWNPEEEDIVGGYRFTIWADSKIKPNGQPNVNTAHLFNFTEEFVKEEFAHGLEMARAFVQPKYQGRQMGRKSIFALDNLWDGIGGLLAKDANLKFMIGKVSVFPSSPEISRNAVIYYLDKYFKDQKGGLSPKDAVLCTPEQIAEYEAIFGQGTAKENYIKLNTFVRSHNDVIPPLIHSYIELSSSMKTYGTAIFEDLGGCIDVCIKITVADIYPEKYERYINSYNA
ncbi:MAG: GNAT family N-acetyltransferase [bacterium]